MGQFPQFLEALPPGMNGGPVVESECAAGLIDMEAAQAVTLVDEHVRIRELTQVVRALSHFDDMRKAGNQLHETWRIALHWRGVMQHHAESVRAGFLQKVGQGLKASFFFEPQGGKVAIENQDLVFGPGQDRIAGLPVFRFTGKQGVGRARH